MNVLGAISKIIHPDILLDELEELIKKLIVNWKDDISFNYNNSAQELAIIICIQQIIVKAGDRIQLIHTKAPSTSSPSPSSSVVVAGSAGGKGLKNLSSSMLLWYLLIGISYACSFNPNNHSDAVNPAANTTGGYQGINAEQLEISQIMLSIYTKSLECSGIGNKLSSIEKTFPIINWMMIYYFNHFSWEKRKQGIQMMKDIFFYQNLSTTATTSSSSSSSSSSNIDYRSQEFLYLVMSLFSLLPGAIWQGQDMLLEAIGFLIARLPVEFFSFEARSAQEIENCVLELTNPSTTSSSSSLVDPSTFPFSLQKMLSTTAPPEISSSSDLASPTPQLAVNPHMESFKQLREKLLFYSLDELTASVTSLTGLATSSRASSADSPAIQWKINLNALISLLLHEMKRGDANYRLIAAQTLAALPWKEIAQRNASVYWTHFPTLLHIAELDLPPLPTIPLPSSSETSKSEEAKKTAAKEEAKKSSAPANKQAFFFGSRYGSAPAAAKAPTRQIRPPPSSAANSSNSNNNNNNNSSNPSANSSSSTEPAKKKMRTSSSSLPPALRMHVIEALSKGWTSSQTLPGPADNTTTTTTPLSLILSNLADFYEEEVWSLKRSYLRLLAAIGEQSSLSSEQLAQVVQVMEKSQEETKFTQLKLAGLECLQSLLLGVNQVALKESFSEKIAAMVRRASTDPQPLVLESVAKLRNL